ncbi:uncharacterized protein LOC144798967 [Lissotriton helveticus]
MEPEVTYAELKFPPTAPPPRKGQVAVVRTAVTTTGKTPVSSPASTKLVRALAILSFILLVLVITLLILSIKWSSQLQGKTAEVMQYSANATFLSEEVRYFSKQWDTSQQNLTQLLAKYATMTWLYQNLSISYQNLSISFQSTNDTLRDVLEQQRQANELLTQMLTWLQDRNWFQCSREEMSGLTAIRCKFCQQEWTLQNMHCYYFSQDARDWWYSQGWCRRHQSQLVTVNSEEEQMFINSRSKDSYDKLWIGYSDNQKEGQWVWDDGSSSHQRFWKWGQPDNYYSENCATTEQTESPTKSWNDDQCMKSYRYICEKDADHVLFSSTGVYS